MSGEYMLNISADTRRFSVVLISNQCLKSSELTGWKKKIPLIAAAVRVSHNYYRDPLLSEVFCVLNMSAL
jgi:hypothetical protein